MKKTKAVATGLAGVGVGYTLWRGWEAGIEKTWAKLFGSSDLGPADFDMLKRRPRPNDALACPKAVAPKAHPDFEPPVFQLSADRLRAIANEYVAGEATAALVYADASKRQDRYVVRTRLMRFPDTVDIRILDLGEGRSTLAIYSRSQIGSSDFGTNRKRIKRWVDGIAERAEKESGS
jgi:uncharacterized protein (DUF1499 family)